MLVGAFYFPTDYGIAIDECCEELLKPFACTLSSARASTRQKDCPQRFACGGKR